MRKPVPVTRATTLRAAFGLPAEPRPFAESALVLIDCQNTYREGTRDLPLPSGGVVPARSVHDASLAGIADLFAVVVNRASDVVR